MSALLQILYDKNVDALLIGNANYRRYITGFLSSFGVYVLTKRQQYLFTDARYAIAAKKYCKRQNIDLYIVKNIGEIYTFLKENSIEKISLPLDVTSAKEFQNLKLEGFSISDCSKELSMCIAVKSAKELQKIKLACKITEKSFLAVLPSLQEGVTELEIAGLLEYNMRKFGAENRAFESIVAFAENSAIPHHTSSTKVLKKGMPVLLDFGASVDGYMADMTRSFLLQPQENTFTNFYFKVHKLVCSAHRRAQNGVQIGSLACNIDGLARAVFGQYVVNLYALKKLQKNGNNFFDVDTLLLPNQQGLSKKYVKLESFFMHSLGHGLGVFIHQSPTLSKTSQDILQENTVFTIEPGIYFEGLFGIRIENTLVLKNKAQSFMQIKKNISKIE